MTWDELRGIDLPARVVARVGLKEFRGQLGRLWGPGGMVQDAMIVRFDDGNTIEVHERNVHLFEPEPTN